MDVEKQSISNDTGSPQLDGELIRAQPEHHGIKLKKW
jgi:hypothetical protein